MRSKPTAPTVDSPRFSPIMLRRPDRLTDQPYWQAHIPFGMWLVEALRPALIVELGVYKGDSYCAFCQAVRELALPTKCFAVDNWRGDVHYGQYGDEILWELSQYHDPRYGGFSKLVRSDFAEAVALFSDKSIDLLHLDGTHTYEAVRADFERWLPKVSERGIVLMHDINERRKDYEVWRFWDELKVRYPSLEFTHSSGLGVLKVGTKPDVAVDWLFTPGEGVDAFKAMVAAIGEGLLSHTLRRSAERERDVLYGEVVKLRAAPAESAAAPAPPPAPVENTQSQRDEDLAEVRRSLAGTLKALEEHYAGLDKRVESGTTDLAGRIGAIAARLDGIVGDLQEASTRLGAFEGEVAMKGKSLDDLGGALAKLRAEVAHNVTGVVRVKEQLGDLAFGVGRAGVVVNERISALMDRIAKAEAELAAVVVKVNVQEGAVWPRFTEQDLRVDGLALEHHARVREVELQFGERAARLEAALHHSEVRLRQDVALAAKQAREARWGPPGRWLRQALRRLREPGVRREIQESGLFDEGFYLQRHPEARSSGMDAVDHFMREGAGRGFAPGPAFDLARYVADYPDVLASEFNPVVHYVRFGRAQGRVIHPAA